MMPIAQAIGRRWRELRGAVEWCKDRLWCSEVIMNDVYESVSFHDLSDQLLARRPCAVQLRPLHTQLEGLVL